MSAASFSLPALRDRWCRRFAVGAAAFAAWLAHAAPAPAARPNFVFIFSDDATWQAIGSYRSGLPVPTPNLDRIAAGGMRFDRCTVGNSICSPSRATMLTGTHSHINGVVDNYTPFDGRQTTYPKLLQAAGYQTMLIGKWHLHSLPTGFEHFDIADGQGNYYNAAFISDTQLKPHRLPGHIDRLIGDKAVTWLREQRDPSRPFALNVHFKVPHRPFLAPGDTLQLLTDVQFPEPPTLFDDYAGKAPGIAAARMQLAHDYTVFDQKIAGVEEPSGPDAGPWRALQKRAAAEAAKLPADGPERVRWIYQRFLHDYARCMIALDQEVGRILDTLDALDLANNTVVLFAGDQGFLLGEHGFFDKRLMYEPSFRTPFLVRAPGVAMPGSSTAALVQNIDWAPTILDLAQLPVPAAMQGRSLVPLLRGEKPDDWRKSVYYNYYEGSSGDHHAPRHEGVATERYKLIHFYEENFWEAYDLAADPAEKHNLIDDPAAAQWVADLRGELARLRQFYQVPANDSIPPAEPRLLLTAGADYSN